MGAAFCPSPLQKEEEDVVVPEAVAAQHDALQKILKRKPYLQKERHILNQYVEKCKSVIADGDEKEAQDALDNLTMELNVEEKTIAAAFMKFDTSGDSVLNEKELEFMLDYLGFPCTQSDVEDLIAAVDNDADGTISYWEFLHHVGSMGGSVELFRARRQQIQDRGGFTDSSFDKDTLRVLLQQAGIQEDAQSYWQLVASPSELDSVARLETCQLDAIRHIRYVAKEHHERALPKLIQRVRDLGFRDTELFMALAWIRELAPFIIHINIDKIGEFLQKDSHYRNQFETNTSGGLLKADVRKKWEQRLYGKAYDTAKPFERPKYGVQNIWNDYTGVQGCVQYGDSYLVLKDVRLRCTLSPEDSANLTPGRLSVPDFYAHVFKEYSDKELSETLRVATGGDERLGDSKAVIEKWGKYKEAQIHGEIDFNRHIDRMVAHERHRKDKTEETKVKAIADAHGWKLTWMDDMKAELEANAGGREMDDVMFMDRLNSFKQEESRVLAVDSWVKDALSPSVVPTSGGTSISWEFSVQDGSTPFDKSCQGTIEDKYQAFKTAGGPSSATVMSRGKAISINFEAMTQQVVGSSRTRDVRRQALS